MKTSDIVFLEITGFYVGTYWYENRVAGRFRMESLNDLREAAKKEFSDLFTGRHWLMEKKPILYSFQTHSVLIGPGKEELNAIHDGMSMNLYTNDQAVLRDEDRFAAWSMVFQKYQSNLLTKS